MTEDRAGAIRIDYKLKLKAAIDLEKRIEHAWGNETLWRQLNIALEAEPRYFLNKMWDELKTMESEFPYLELAKLKKEYKEELAQQKNKNGISGYRVR